MKNIILVILVAGHLQAGNLLVDGSKAWEQIENGNKNYNSLALGFYMGTISGVSASLDGKQFCIPKDISNNQLCAIVRKYIKNNPEEWNNGNWMIFSSLGQAFPCKKKK
ncbi:Rap1a/Tai family immunity protein [Sulfurimonas hydrogeniphila]|uniref:Rap1a/Tai family immunity protein n=1 Tax=Sulfurimonas TaxID=202746 RepID=UPI00125EBF12|nr:Rap1a/Tai family immunity protein [Sulfurimonas hydrogeniphila]